MSENISIAKSIKKKLDKLYVSTGFTGMKIAQYLSDGKIESGGEDIEKPIECSLSDDKVFGVFTYEDKSMLIVTEYDCLTAMKD